MEEFIEKLRTSGFKVTPRRKAIISLFLKKGGIFSPQDVQQALKEEIGQCGLPGIYRNLESMAVCGILFRIVTFSGERRYALCNAAHAEGHHHHVVCISCGKVGNVSSCLYRDGMTINGYRLVNHVVQLNGVCEICAQQQNT